MEYLCPDTDNQFESGAGLGPKRREARSVEKIFLN
jgi:hypothetical protein